MSWPHSASWGWWCRPGSPFASRRPGLRLAGMAVLVPGRDAAGRREREGREQDRGIHACPSFLTPASLRFFDKNLKG